MRDFLILLVVALVVAGGYGYHNNPKECRQLGLDIVNDTKAIFLAPDSAKGTTDESPVAGTAPSVPVVSPGPAATIPIGPSNSTPGAPAVAVTQSPPAPVVTATPPPPQHYSVGFVAQDNAPAPNSSAPSAGPTTAVPTATTPARQAPAIAPANLASLTDYNEALQTARSQHQPILILFTGSDWCPYCQKLDQEVLSDGGFQNYRSNHYVFLTIDDLRNSPVSDDDKQRVQDLEQKFHVVGFPTLIVIDENEHEKGRIEGYGPGSGPSAVMNRLDQIAQAHN